MHPNSLFWFLIFVPLEPLPQYILSLSLALKSSVFCSGFQTLWGWCNGLNMSTLIPLSRNLYLPSVVTFSEKGVGKWLGVDEVLTRTMSEFLSESHQVHTYFFLLLASRSVKNWFWSWHHWFLIFSISLGWVVQIRIISIFLPAISQVLNSMPDSAWAKWKFSEEWMVKMPHISKV